MKLKYKDAMENLQAMFQNFDQETIHSILVMHKGAVQPTIEDLLRLSNEQEQEDNENMFANDAPNNYKNSGGNNNNGGGDDFLDPSLVDSENSEYYARKLQEKEDMKLAMALQQKYIASEQQQQQQYQDDEEEEGEDDAQQETYDVQAAVKTGGYKKFSDEPDQNKAKGKKVVPGKKPLQQNQLPKPQQQQEENQEVISFDLNEQDSQQQNGFVFHQYNGGEMKNSGLNSHFEEMKINDEDSDFKTDTKGIDTKKKKSFWSNLFSKKSKGSN